MKKEEKAKDSLDKIKEKTSEENEAWLKANLDYVGRSYSIYLYFILVVAITSTTYLLSIPNTPVNSNQQVNTLDFIVSLDSITTNRMYNIIITWIVYLLALDFLAHRYVNKYNQILSSYYSKSSRFFIERRTFISEYPGKLLAFILIPVAVLLISVLEKTLASLKKFN